jgi:hypothetical protein
MPYPIIIKHLRASRFGFEGNFALHFKAKSSIIPLLVSVLLAITTAYVYSSAVVFGLSGDVFFWELATLTDVMLLGHWLEMRSIMAASSALEELAKLVPSEAHKVMPDGSVVDVPLDKGNNLYKRGFAPLIFIPPSLYKGKGARGIGCLTISY